VVSPSGVGGLPLRREITCILLTATVQPKSHSEADSRTIVCPNVAVMTFLIRVNEGVRGHHSMPCI